ncbi:MAG: hypothetical protein RL367_1492 [Pseudomonadota bacterium]
MGLSWLESMATGLCRAFGRNFSVFYGLLILLYGSVGLQSYGFEDEVFNINLIEHFGLGTLSIVQQGDFHPPGSYALNIIMHAVLGDWSLVRMATGVIAASLLLYLVNHIRNSHGTTSGLIAWCLIGLNPATLMWCTSLRWYAFFVPVVAVLCVLPKPASGRGYWAKLMAGMLILGYLGYAAFVIFPPLFLLYWYNCTDKMAVRLRHIALTGGIAALLYLYQLVILFQFHLSRNGEQVSDIKSGLIGLAVTQFSNQGLFPVSFAGILSAAAMAVLIGLALADSVKTRTFKVSYLAYAIACAALVLTGLGGKVRNYLVVEPLKTLALGDIARTAGTSRAFATMSAIAAIILGNLWGCYNVATHQGTSKNSWNMPVGAALATLDGLTRECGERPLVLAHDSLLLYWFVKSGYRTVGPVTGATTPTGIHEKCLVAVKSYRGSIRREKLTEIYTALDQIHARSVTISQLGRDSAFAIKQRIDPDYPEYAIEMIVKRDAVYDGLFDSWATYALASERRLKNRRKHPNNQ